MTYIDLNVNKTAALSQLKSLGYKDGDKVYLRFFFPKKDIRAKGVEATETTKAIQKDAGRKLDCVYPNLNWRQIKSYQEAGRGCYFVVNGQGDEDKDIKEGRSFFYEHDDLDLDQQTNLWKTLGLPEPTIQINTGGKSVHSYWHLSNPCSVEEWKEFHKDLIEFASSDKSLKNPSRVMRLAGAFHISVDKETQERTYNQTLIISNSGTSYEYESLRAIVPKAQKKEVEIPKVDLDLLTSSHDKEGEIPLIQCIAKCNAQAILKGLPIGERDTGALRVARDLIGTANYLESIGQPYSGDARYLYDRYSDFCDTANPGRLDEIWDNALTYYSKPSLDPEYIKNVVNAWYLKNDADKIQNEINELGNKVPTNVYKSFETKTSILQEQVEDLDAKEYQSRLNTNTQALKCWGRIKNSFPKDVIKAIDQDYENAGVTHEANVLALLGGLSGALSGKYKIHVGGNWFLNLNTYCILLANKGSKKSYVIGQAEKAAQNLHTENLEEYKQLKKQYEYELEQYKADVKNGNAEPGNEPLPPNQKYDYVGSGTFAYLISALKSNENFNRGFIQCADEAATILKALNKHDGGGDDLANYLSIQSGKGISKGTAGKGEEFAKSPRMSLLTSCQPDVWVNEILASCNRSGNGFLDRFLAACLDPNDQKPFIHGKDYSGLVSLSTPIERYLRLFNEIEEQKVADLSGCSNDLKNEISLWVHEEQSDRAKDHEYIYKIAFIIAAMRDHLNPVVIDSDLLVGWEFVRMSQAIKENMAYTTSNGTAESAISRATTVYEKNGKLTPSLLRSSNSSVFGKLEKTELAAIIKKVKEINGGEISTSHKGSIVLTRKESEETKPEENQHPKIDKAISKVDEIIEVKPDPIEVVRFETEKPSISTEDNTVQNEKIELVNNGSSVLLLENKETEFNLGDLVYVNGDTNQYKITFIMSKFITCQSLEDSTKTITVKPINLKKV